MAKGYLVIVLIIGLFLINPLPAWSQSEDTQEDRLEERLEDRGVERTAAEELIEMLKKKALRKIEAERKKQLWATKGTIGLHIGYDNNVNTDSTRKGDFYHEQYFAFSWVPTFNDYLAADIGTWYYSDIYSDNTDTTILDNAFNASVKWYPRGEPSLEVTPKIERAYAYYPYTNSSTYVEDKTSLKIKHKFWKRWSQEAKYEYGFKEYDVKHPRTGPGSSSYVTSMVLEKTKQSLEYNFGFPMGKNNAKLKQKAYKETSNDAYVDYYDLYSYKITGELGRSLNKKLYAKYSAAYERKNYWQRNVSTGGEAEFDDVYTHKLNFYYTLKKDWTLSYTWTYKKSMSNYDVYDYDTMSHLAGVYISF